MNNTNGSPGTSTCVCQQDANGNFVCYCQNQASSGSSGSSGTVDQSNVCGNNISVTGSQSVDSNFAGFVYTGPGGYRGYLSPVMKLDRLLALPG